MRVRVRKIGNASHPSEVVVQVKTIEGIVDFVVDKHSLDANETVSIGVPVSRKSGLWQIELPCETTRGFRRVWVKASALAPERWRTT